MLDSRLKTFIALCKVLNYTKTAEILHITQPAVSQHIKYLEQEYNQKLFTYSGKSLSLTNAGEILYEFAIGMEASAEKTRLMMSLPIDSYPPINFGSTRTIGEYTMPKIIAKLLNDYPNIEVEMSVDNTQTLLNKLDNGEIDFALLEGQFDKSRYNSMLLSQESFIGVCSANHYFAQTEVTFNDVFNERIIVREKGSGTREIFEQILYEHNVCINSFNRILEIGNINAIKELVSLNQGVTFLYKEAVQRELFEGSLCKIQINDFDVVREFNFVFLKNSLHVKEYTDWYNYFKKNRKL